MSQQRSRNSYYQRLVNRGSIPMSASRELRGRAKQFADCYERIKANAIRYAEQDGYEIRLQYGPRGGAWGGTIFAFTSVSIMPIEFHSNFGS